MKKPHVVTIGGGTGQHTILRGLKELPVAISAIVSMADDGGSTGVLRDCTTRELLRAKNFRMPIMIGIANAIITKAAPRMNPNTTDIVSLSILNPTTAPSPTEKATTKKHVILANVVIL
jgi:tartrate dehydratase beta subunit/fumarate hydratase class I family protein